MGKFFQGFLDRAATVILMFVILCLLLVSLVFGSALTADRNTPRRDGDLISRPLEASAKIYAGSMVCMNTTGYAIACKTGTNLIPLGRAESQVDNTGGSAGAKTVVVRTGVFRWANSTGADVINTPQIGYTAYIVDDQTVAKTSNSGARSIAGTIVDKDASGVWVKMGVNDAPNLSTSISALHKPVYCNTTASETDADSTIIEGHAGVLSTDQVVAILNSADNATWVRKAVASSGLVTITLNAVGGANTTVNFCIFNAVNQ